MEPGWFWDFIRNILSFLDSAGYALVSSVYNVFFTVVNAQIFSGDVLDTFFTRVQLILGIFMIFNLAITAINIIINPDLFKDKEKGAGKIIMRIALSLIMLTLVVPINVPNTNGNPLTEQISNNGILFGFLNQFQDSVMKDNVLGKLILGSNVESNEGNYGDLDNMSDIGGTLATTVSKAFITPALKDRGDDPDVNAYDIKEEDVLCKEAITDYSYNDPNLSYKNLMRYINVECDSEEGEVYIFDYTPLLGLVCSIIMAIIIIGFTLDVAVRAIKLALLRLISPIPIISYIIPGQEKNGAFGNWVKTLTSTYLDLFLRIIIIYFGAYVILIISEGGINIWQNGPGFFTSLFATVFIIIGILVFMKQAPKFFQDMLGIKGDGKLFSGIGTMLGAAALTGGLAGSAIGSFKTGMAEGKELGYGAGRSIWRGVRAGAGGILGGAYTGTKALVSADKNAPSAVMTAMQKRNAMRGTGSTLLGRVGSNASALFMGSSLGGKASQMAEVYEKAASAARAHKQMLEEEALKDMETVGIYYGVTGEDKNGNKVALAGNYKDIVNRITQARAENKDYVEFDDGRRFNLKQINENVLEKLKESQTAAYAASSKAKENKKVQGTAQELTYAFNKADLKVDPYDYNDGENNVKLAIGVAMEAERKIKTDPRTQWNIANDRATNNNNK